METIYTKNKNDIKTIELKLPQWLTDQHTVKIVL